MDLDELKRLLAAATPGPWQVQHHGSTEVRALPQTLLADMGSIGNHRRDAALIVALRNAAPELIAEVERLRAAVEAADKIVSLSQIEHATTDTEQRWDEALAAFRAARGAR